MKKILSTVVLVMLVISLSSCAFSWKNDINENDEETVLKNKYITIGLVNADTYNPILTNSPTVRDLTGFIFEPLFSFSDKMMPEGVLVESYTTSPDGKSITLKFKQGVKWHDGSEFICHDVIYTIEQLKEGSSYYSNFVSGISETIAIDYYTLIIKFNNSTPNPVNLLTFPIIKQNSQDSTEFELVGTGPFKYNTDKLTVFESYHGNAPKLSEIRIKNAPDIEKYISMFNASVFDISNSDIVDMKSYTPKSNAQVKTYVSNRMIYVGFNADSPVFINREARESVSKLIDRKNIASHIYLSCATATSYPINPASIYYPKSEINLYSDTATAEEILKANAWELNNNGIYHLKGMAGATYFTVEILVNSNDEYRIKVAEELSEAMNNAGMFTTVTKCDEAQFVNYIKNGNYDMFVGETELMPNSDLTQLLFSGENVLRYANPDCDALLTQLGTLTEADDIKTAWQNISDIVITDYPIAPICFINESLITSARLKSGVVPSPVSAVQRTENWSLQ